jgi:hypothetical protein
MRDEDFDEGDGRAESVLVPGLSGGIVEKDRLKQV